MAGVAGKAGRLPCQPRDRARLVIPKWVNRLLDFGYDSRRPLICWDMSQRWTIFRFVK